MVHRRALQPLRTALRVAVVILTIAATLALFAYLEIVGGTVPVDEMR